MAGPATGWFINGTDAEAEQPIGELAAEANEVN